MQISELWQWYADKKRIALVQEGTVALSPDEVLSDFWTFHPLFSGRLDAIKAVPYSTDFDDEADGALMALAFDDSFDTWEGVSAGAWRVLYERFLFCSVVVAANIAARQTVIDHLPRGLDPVSRARTLLLRYLLGHGRKIDRRVLPRTPPGKLPLFPASATLRRH